MVSSAINGATSVGEKEGSKQGAAAIAEKPESYRAGGQRYL